MELTVLRKLNNLEINVPLQITGDYIKVNDAVVSSRRINIPESTVRVKIEDTWQVVTLDQGHYAIDTVIDMVNAIDGIMFTYNEVTDMIQVDCDGEAEIDPQLALVLKIPAHIQQEVVTSTEAINIDKKPWTLKANINENSDTNLLNIVTDSTQNTTNSSLRKTMERVVAHLMLYIHDNEDEPVEFTDGILYLQLTFIHEQNDQATNQ